MAGVLLGKEKGTGKDIYLSSEARRLGSYMVGLQGMGKTNLLLQIALQDIENGDGLCVISPHAELIEDLLLRIPENRIDDVIVFDPSSDYPVGINILEWDGETPIEQNVDLVADQIVGIFRQLWEGKSWGPQLEETMTITAQTLAWAQTLPPEKRPTMREFMTVLTPQEAHLYREFLLDHIRENHTSSVLEDIFDYWFMIDNMSDRDRAAYVNAVRNKVRPFRSNQFLAHIFGQSKTAIDLGHVMTEDKILLVDLSVDKLGDGNVGLLGSLIVGRLFLSAITRQLKGQEAQAKRFHIIADEFRYFAMSSFDRLQDEARKFNVDVLLAHQRRGQLNDTMLDATKTARNWIVLNVNPDDAEELAMGFDSTPPESIIRKRLGLGLATRPWSSLLNQAHTNPRVNEAVHEINTRLVSDIWWTIKLDRLDLVEIIQVFEKAGLGEFDELVKKYPDWGRDDSVVVFASTKNENQILEKNLEQILYQMMIGEGDEPHTQELLSGWVNSLYRRFSSNPDFGSWKMIDTDPELPIPSLEWARLFLKRVEYSKNSRHLNTVKEQSASLKKMVEQQWWQDLQKDEYRRVSVWEITDPILMEMIAKDRRPFVHRYGNQLIDFMHMKRRLQFRTNMAFWLVQLGYLLSQEPVWVSGGQPIEEEQNTRSYGDVTNEWQNRFAHLPQFEAWVKVQEERVIAEYHIETQEVETPIRSSEQAQALRKKSGEAYGLSREDIETQIKKRNEINYDNDLESSEVLDE